MKRVFLTGGTGFLGSHLLCKLVEKGFSVKALYRTQKKLDQLFSEVPFLKNSDQVEWVKGDLFSDDWDFEDIDLVYHLAGYVGYSKNERAAMDKVNVEGTKKVLDKLQEVTNDIKLIYLSSVVAVGAGQNSAQVLNEESDFNLSKFDLGYFETKKEAEDLVIEASKKGLFAISLNPSTIYGKRDMLKSSRKSQLSMAKGKLKFYPEGGVSIVHVDDVCKALLEAPLKGKSGNRYILAGDNITIYQLLSEIADQAGVKRPSFKLPKKVLLTLGFIGDLLKRVGINTGLGLEQLRVVTMYHWFDSSKAKEELYFNPVSYKEAIKESLDWAKKEKMF